MVLLSLTGGSRAICVILANVSILTGLDLYASSLYCVYTRQEEVNASYAEPKTATRRIPIPGGCALVVCVCSAHRTFLVLGIQTPSLGMTLLWHQALWSRFGAELACAASAARTSAAIGVPLFSSNIF